MMETSGDDDPLALTLGRLNLWEIALRPGRQRLRP
jgi:hypothetical protein